MRSTQLGPCFRRYFPAYIVGLAFMCSTQLCSCLSRPFHSQRAASIWMDIVIRLETIKIILFACYHILFSLDTLHNLKMECFNTILGIGPLKMNVVTSSFTQILEVISISRLQINRTADIEE